VTREIPTPDDPTKVTLPAPVDPGSVPTGRARVAVASSLDSMRFLPTIRSSTIGTRDRVMADVESRITASQSAIGSMHQTGEMSADGRKAFKQVSDDVKEKAKALRKSVQAARKADASEWENARAQVAADYEAYATALASLDAAAGLPPARP
jgi:hypothetical protein